MSILSRESLKKAAYPIGIAMALFQLYYTIGYGVLEGSLLAAIFLSFALTMIFLLHPAVKPREGRREPAFLLFVDLVLAACQCTSTSTMKSFRNAWPTLTKFPRRPWRSPISLWAFRWKPRGA